MSVDRAPITRPSVAGIVGDNHTRVRALEAGQTMPYCRARLSFEWLESEYLPWMEDWPGYPGFVTNLDTTFMQFVSYDAGTCLFYTTDTSIFAPTPIATVAGRNTVGGIDVTGGGLFWWQIQWYVTTDSLLSDPNPTQANWWLGSSFTIDPEVSGNQIDEISPYQRNLTGIRSVTGYPTLLEDESQGPPVVETLTSFMQKQPYPFDETLELFVTVDVTIARWTPVGFFPQNP